MNRFWAIVFLLVPIAGVATFIVAPYYNIWFSRDVFINGHLIDSLFFVILSLIGVAFIGLEIVLAYCIWRYGSRRRGARAKYTHGSHALEVVWPIVVATALLLIAIFQIDAWAEAKSGRPTTMHDGKEVPKPPIAEVTGRQFEWRIRYPGQDGELGTADDIHTVNDLHLPVDEEIVLRIKSEDVLHNFFLPNLRIRQDVVPGIPQTIWFTSTEKGEFDIVCAELCGWGQSKMEGRVTFESRSDFEKYLNERRAIEQMTHLPSIRE